MKSIDENSINVMKKVEMLYTISENFVKYKKLNSLTKDDMAKKLNIDYNMLEKIESGKYNPTFKKLFDLTYQLTGNSKMFINILESMIYNIKLVDEVKENFENKNIYVNSKIMELEESCIKYIIIHELCHLKYKTHAKGFYKLLT